MSTKVKGRWFLHARQEMPVYPKLNVPQPPQPEAPPASRLMKMAREAQQKAVAPK